MLYPTVTKGMNSLRAIRLADLMRIVRLLRVLRVANTMRQWEMINVPNPWKGWKGSDGIWLNAFWVWIDGIASKFVASYTLPKEFFHFGKDGRSTLGICSKDPPVHDILAFLFFPLQIEIGRWKKQRFPQRETPPGGVAINLWLVAGHPCTHLLHNRRRWAMSMVNIPQATKCFNCLQICKIQVYSNDHFSANKLKVTQNDKCMTINGKCYMEKKVPTPKK